MQHSCGSGVRRCADACLCHQQQCSCTGKEERASGSVGWKVVGAYVVAGGGVAWIIRLVFVYAMEQGSKVIIDTWAGWWATETWGQRGNVFYLGIYAALAVFFACATYVRSIVFTFGCVRFCSLLALTCACAALLRTC